MPTKLKKSSSGVAIIIVIFLIALASIAVLSLAKTSYLGSRLMKNSEQQLQAEYLLKSGLSFSRALIAADKDFSDPKRDKLWGMFTQGETIPLQTLGIEGTNATLSLEIRSADGKLPIKALKDSGTGSGPTHDNFVKWRDIFTRFFQKLNFDNDKDIVRSGPFKGKFFDSQQMVANLIDYMDADNESYQEGAFAKGIESELGEEKFPNREPQRLSELSVIPGFTPRRIRQIADHVMFLTNSAVNVNFASSITLKALDDSADDSSIAEIIDHVNKIGPYTNTEFDQILPNLLPNFQALKGTFLGYRTSYFQVVVKVQYGDNRYFLKSFLKRANSGGDSRLPTIISYELIG